MGPKEGWVASEFKVLAYTFPLLIQQFPPSSFSVTTTSFDKRGKEGMLATSSNTTSSSVLPGENGK
jgi:hypothetical protein